MRPRNRIIVGATIADRWLRRQELARAKGEKQEFSNCITVTADFGKAAGHYFLAPYSHIAGSPPRTDSRVMGVHADRPAPICVRGSVLNFALERAVGPRNTHFEINVSDTTV